VDVAVDRRDIPILGHVLVEDPRARGTVVAGPDPVLGDRVLLGDVGF
jgi:hypothetical protein